jgi:hypothetical protein
LFGRWGERVHIVWLIIVFALTFVFPVVWMMMMKKLEMIESLQVSKPPKERIIPFIAAATFLPVVRLDVQAERNDENTAPIQLIFYMMLGASLGSVHQLFDQYL